MDIFFYLEKYLNIYYINEMKKHKQYKSTHWTKKYSKNTYGISNSWLFIELVWSRRMASVQASKLKHGEVIVLWITISFSGSNVSVLYVLLTSADVHSSRVTNQSRCATKKRFFIYYHICCCFFFHAQQTLPSIETSLPDTIYR